MVIRMVSRMVILYGYGVLEGPHCSTMSDTNQPPEKDAAKNKTGPALLAPGNSRTARPPPPAASPPPRVPARLPTANVRHLPSPPFRADLVQPNRRGQVSGSRRRIFHYAQHAHAEHYNSTTNNNRFETAALILRGGQDGGGCGGRRGYGAHHIAGREGRWYGVLRIAGRASRGGRRRSSHGGGRRWEAHTLHTHTRHTHIHAGRQEGGRGACRDDVVYWYLIQ